MNEYYNYAENAEQCGNVPPVNVYGRADGSLYSLKGSCKVRPKRRKYTASVTSYSL